MAIWGFIIVCLPLLYLYWFSIIKGKKSLRKNWRTLFTSCNAWLYYIRLEFEKQKTRLNIQLEYSRNQLKKKLNRINTLKETVQKGREDIDNLKKVIIDGVSSKWWPPANNRLFWWCSNSDMKGHGVQTWEMLVIKSTQFQELLDIERAVPWRHPELWLGRVVEIKERKFWAWLCDIQTAMSSRWVERT